jgi:hypothetical protein
MLNETFNAVLCPYKPLASQVKAQAQDDEIGALRVVNHPEYSRAVVDKKHHFPIGLWWPQGQLGGHEDQGA